MLGLKMREVVDFAVDSYQSLKGEIGGLDGGAMPARWVPGRSDSLFALSREGDFHLLIRLPSEILVNEKRLNSLRITAGSRYVLSDSRTGSAIEGSFAAIILDSREIDLLASFGGLAAILLSSLALAPSATEVVKLLDEFLRLFAPRKTVPRSQLLGLWGELWLIRSAEDSNRMIGAWHQENSDRFDFSFRRGRVEVKTTENPGRTHHFSLAQLEVQDKPTWIASIAAVPDPAGWSVLDLLEEALSSAGPENRSKLTRNCLGLLSGDVESAQDFSFSASGSMPIRLIDSTAVPRVSVPPGSSIFDVHFQVNLTTLVDASEVSLDSLLLGL